MSDTIDPITEEEIDFILAHDQENHTGDEPFEVLTDPSTMDEFSSDIDSIYGF